MTTSTTSYPSQTVAPAPKQRWYDAIIGIQQTTSNPWASDPFHWGSQHNRSSKNNAREQAARGIQQNTGNPWASDPFHWGSQHNGTSKNNARKQAGQDWRKVCI